MIMSGVNVYIFDESFVSYSTINLAPLVFMRTKRGFAHEQVSLSDFEDKIGYDLNFNNSYLGLEHLLQSATYVDVIRLENGTAYGNLIVSKNGLESWSETGVDDITSFIGATELKSVAATISSVPYNVTLTGGLVRAGTYKLRKASDNSLLAHDNGIDGTLVADNSSGVVGTVTYSTGAVAITAMSNLPLAVKHEYTYDSDASLAFYMNTRGNWGDVAIKITLESAVQYLYTYLKINGSYVQQEKIAFSWTPTDANFIEKAAETNSDFVGVKFLTAPTFTAFSSGGDPVALLNASDGSDLTTVPSDALIAAQAMTNLFVVSNGLIVAGMQSTLMEWAAGKKKVFFTDIADVTTYADALAYLNTISYRTFSAAAMFVTDEFVIDGNSYVIYPSVYLMKAYINMYSQTGRVEYSPAGYIYGSVAANKLRVTDVSSHGDDLKTNKINYISSGSRGAVIWEDRTLYALESDLSYITTVVSLYTLGNKCKNFTDNFPFQYVTQNSLALVKTGLEQVCKEWLDFGFIWSFEVVVPTWDFIKANGARTVNISINVKFAEVGENYNLNFHLKKSA